METFTIVDDSQTSNWELSGYSDKNTCKGVSFAKIYEDSGSYYVALYKDSERSSLVANGSIGVTKGAVTLAAQNSSGLTGSVTLDYTGNTEFELITFYACYEDLCSFERNMSNLFDENSKIADRIRFESFVEQGKRLIDSHLATRFSRSGMSNPPNRSNIKDAQALKVPTIYAALSALYWFLKSDFNDSNFKQALHYQKLLENWLAVNPIVFSREGIEIVLEASAIFIRRA